MGKTATSIVKQRQDPLRERYRSAPNEAVITDCARTIADSVADPFHGAVLPGEGMAHSGASAFTGPPAATMTYRIPAICCVLPSPVVWTQPFAWLLIGSTFVSKRLKWR